MQRMLILLVPALFGALAAAVLWRHGELSRVLLPLQRLAGSRVPADLVIPLTLVLAWLVQDTPAPRVAPPGPGRRRRRPWARSDRWSTC
jgi:hypothetical protein